MKRTKERKNNTHLKESLPALRMSELPLEVWARHYTTAKAKHEVKAKVKINETHIWTSTFSHWVRD